MERIGHRGANREFPENTIAAFKAAFERGADAIELDVHATRDGTVIVHHDSTLGATFGALRGRPIAELEWREVAVAAESARHRIPTLSEVLGIVPAGGTVYVEIKGAGIEERVAEAISAGSGVGRAWCAVHSFDHAAVARMRDLAPTLPRGVLVDRRRIDMLAAMREAGARDLWPEWRLIDQPLVEGVHAIGGRIIAWTVNDRSAAERLVALGVDGLCTDDVRQLDGL